MSRPKRWALFGAALVAAGVSWTIGAPTVILHPQLVPGTISLMDGAGTAVPLVSYNVEAVPHATGWPYDDISSIQVSPATPTWSMTLDGGNPADPGNLGRDYNFGVVAYTRSDSTGSSYTRIRRSNAVNVSTSVSPHPNVPLSFSGLRRVPARLVVENGTVRSFNVHVSAYSNGEEYYSQGDSYNSNTTGSQSTDTLVTCGCPSVWVSGYATVATMVNGEERTSSFSLSGVSRNLSAGDGAEVVWTVNAAPQESISGTVVSSAEPPGVGPRTSRYVEIRGAGSSNSGFSVYAPVASDSSYMANVPAGDYDVRPYETYFPPHAYHQWAATRVTVGLAEARDLDLVQPTLYTATMPLAFEGLYDIDSVSSPYVQMLRLKPPYGSWDGWVSAYQSYGEFSVPITADRWRPYSMGFNIQQAAPNYVNSHYSRYFTELSMPSFTAASSYILPAQTVTLTRATVFLSRGTSGSELLSSPSAQLDRYDYDQDSQLLQSVRISAYGQSAATRLATIQVVAEPGEYILTPRATADGTSVSFPESTILFGEPETISPGQQVVEVTPDLQQGLRIKLDFGEPSSGGVATVVQTSQGPQIPEGFTTLCTPNPDDPEACPQLYYDIDTTADVPAGGVQVCIRQQYSGIPAGQVDGIAGSIGLFHFEQNGTCDPFGYPDEPGSCWERLSSGAQNCADDLAACGCATPADCGISAGVTVLQICGQATSFSPFAVFQAPARFSATGTGATGTMQSWLAPATGKYRISAIGAKGGAGTLSPSLSGGCGAEVAGDFSLTEGDTLEILVGQPGKSTAYQGGGGGGSFVARGATPLLVAGGGGGVRHASTVNGRNASLTTSGTSGSTSPSYTSGFVAGGTAGRGGARSSTFGAGGGGWLTSGANDGTNGEGGHSFTGANRGRGGAGLRCDGPPFADGGFGGGGAGNGCYGAGGGGGYSGGGSGRVGGGGGSYNGGTNPSGAIKCLSDGEGRVEIRWIGP